MAVAQESLVLMESNIIIEVPLAEPLGTRERRQPDALGSDILLTSDRRRPVAEASILPVSKKMKANTMLGYFSSGITEEGPLKDAREALIELNRRKLEWRLLLDIIHMIATKVKEANANAVELQRKFKKLEQEHDESLKKATETATYTARRVLKNELKSRADMQKTIVKYRKEIDLLKTKIACINQAHAQDPDALTPSIDAV